MKLCNVLCELTKCITQLYPMVFFLSCTMIPYFYVLFAYFGTTKPKFYVLFVLACSMKQKFIEVFLLACTTGQKFYTVFVHTCSIKLLCNALFALAKHIVQKFLDFWLAGRYIINMYIFQPRLVARAAPTPAPLLSSFGAHGKL